MILRKLCLIGFFIISAHASDQQEQVYLCCNNVQCNKEKTTVVYSGADIDKDPLPNHNILLNEKDKRELLPVFTQLGKEIQQNCWLVNNSDIKQEVLKTINLANNGITENHVNINSGLIGNITFYHIEEYSFSKNDGLGKRELIGSTVVGGVTGLAIIAVNPTIRRLFFKGSGLLTLAIGTSIGTSMAVNYMILKFKR